MSDLKEYSVDVEYTVTESISVEASNPDEAEKKAYEMLRLGVTQRNIIGDTSEEAETVSIEEVENES